MVARGRVRVDRLCAPQVSEPPKKLRKWRKKLGKAKNTLHLSVLGGRGRTLAVPNWAFKGPFDLYRGVSGALLGTLPTALVYFAVYERVSAALEAQPPPPDQSIGEGRGVAGEEASRAPQAHRPRPRSAATVHLLSAAAGAVASSVVRVPGDTVRHQTQAYMHRSVAGAFTSIVASRGVRGLYLGYLPTLCRDVPELAIQFSVYEALRKAVAGRREAAPNGRPQKLATWEHLLLGGLAGAVAACVTMPLDFVKTRQQCGAPGSLASLVRGVVATEGVAGLFQGLAPRVLHVAATSAVFFGLFEGAKLLLKPDREDSDKMLFRKARPNPGGVCRSSGV